MIKELREIRRDRERNGRETDEGERRRGQNAGDFPELHERVLEDREQLNEKEIRNAPSTSI